MDVPLSWQLAKLVISIGIVLGLSLVAERVSARMAGMLAGYPLGTAIALYFIGLEISPAFATESAVHTLAGFSATLALSGGYLIGARRDGRFPGDHVSLPGDSAPDPRGSHGGRGDQALPRRPGFAALLCPVHLGDLRQPGLEYGYAHWLWSGDFVAFGLDAGSGLAARKKRRFGLTQRFLVEGYNVF